MNPETMKALLDAATPPGPRTFLVLCEVNANNAASAAGWAQDAFDAFSHDPADPNAQPLGKVIDVREDPESGRARQGMAIAAQVLPLLGAAFEVFAPKQEAAQVVPPNKLAELARIVDRLCCIVLSTDNGPRAAHNLLTRILTGSPVAIPPEVARALRAAHELLTPPEPAAADTERAEYNRARVMMAQSHLVHASDELHAELHAGEFFT